jgi:predicted transcriptional regulator
MWSENRNRMRVARAVISAPGIHMRELQRAVGLSFATVRHHAARLAQAGIIERFSQGGYERLFPKGFTDSDKLLVSATRGNTARLVLRAIFRDAFVSNKDISGETGLAKSTVTKYLHLFLGLGIVSKSVSPQGRTLYTSTSQSRVAQLLKFGETNLRLAVDNYTELWDF